MTDIAAEGCITHFKLSIVVWFGMKITFLFAFLCLVCKIYEKKLVE